MKRISAPYSFVPLNSKVYIPTWHNKVSQDIPFEDGEDGIIEVKWRNVSPLIIRDGETDKEQAAQSMFIDLPDGTRRYFIPGSSLKGMLRNVMAIMSFGKFKAYNTHFEKKSKNKKVQTYSIANLVEKEQPLHDNASHDLCETIFGWTGGNSMKGRIQIGHAFCNNELNMVRPMPEISGVLGQPKASYHPLYLKQDEKQYSTYDDKTARISGWKRYRIHQENTPLKLPKGNKNENTISRFCPLKAGLIFTMRISIHNLRKIEIGALLSAITFHRTQGVWHNIGGAKSFGYGKLECCSVTLNDLQYDESEYLWAFEKEMDQFTHSYTKEKWTECRRIKALVAIASEHDNNAIRMMEQNEYTKGTKSLPYQEGEDKGLNSAYKRMVLIQQQKETKQKEENKRQEYKKSYDKIKSLCKEGDLTQAKTILENIIKELKSAELSTEAEEKQLKDIKQQIVQKTEDEEKERIVLVLNDGFDSYLNEKYPNGEKFKVDCWKTCSSKTNSWLKKTNKFQLTTEEQDVLAKVVCRLKANPKERKEKKEWENAAGKIWKEIADYLSQDRADKLFKGEEQYD